MSFGHELKIDYYCDFELVGIVCSAREYKLAWCINQCLDFNLAKSEDLVIKFVSEPDIVVSNFAYSTDYISIWLLKNRSEDQDYRAYLLPELKNMDYFLFIKDESDTFETAKCIRKLSDISVTKSCHRIDIEKLTNKENLLF